MCGIGGITTHGGQLVDPKCLKRLEHHLKHRGPDDFDVWINSARNAGLAHRRLAIIDLSPAGHQPMHSADGRFTIVFNGEIYNYQDLRNGLLRDSAHLKGHSDTEVILELFAREGPDCVRKFEGMFAIAIWDSRSEQLFLARDPLGIKPLYVWEHRGTLAFSSELRALVSTKIGPVAPDFNAIADFLWTGSVPEPQSIISGIRMLPAGHQLLWQNGQSTTTQFWNIERRQDEEVIPWERSVAITRNAFLDSVSRHFVSDVPVGIFLSGGIDSTAILSAARQVGIKDICTFSIAFNETTFDEGWLAKRTAESFGTEHYEWRMTAKDGQDLFRDYLSSMDQPSNDGFNTYCVSKFAHDHGLKVVLSGLGGDELFGSYASFRTVPQLCRWYRHIARFGLTELLGSALAKFWSTGPKARLGEFLASSGEIEHAYTAVRSCFTRTESLKLTQRLLGHSSNQPARSNLDSSFRDWPPPDQISYLEMTRYMRNQLLRDSDVMSMAWSLELRVPFVDQPLVDTLFGIPHLHRYSGNKRLLVEATQNIPAWILDQPKRGFRFPFQEWLDNDTRWNDELAETLRLLPVSPSLWYQKWMLIALTTKLKTILEL